MRWARLLFLILTKISWRLTDERHDGIGRFKVRGIPKCLRHTKPPPFVAVGISITSWGITLEFKGKNTGEIKLTGVIVAQSVSDIDQIKKMVAAGDRAEPQTLISGSNALGRNWGKWVMTEFTEEQSEFISDGTPQVITWSITMQEYGT